MPSTYAHYRFGQEVRNALPCREQKTVDSYPELYMIGLHGPDILFYYHALRSNPVNTTGFELHEKSGKSFFENARNAIVSNKNPDAALSYAYGVLCHFALDVNCHAYIDKKIAVSGISHAEIESEFDRSLMLLDGIEPTSHIQTAHIIPSKENAEIISPFYPGISPTQIHKALRSMIFQNKMLLAKSDAKRRLIYAILHLTGNYEKIHGMIISPHGNPLCEDSNAELTELYRLAEERAKIFITSFDGYLSGKQSLDPIFDYTFGGVLPESGVNI